MVDIGTGAKSQTIHESGRTTMAVIPVKVGARDTDRSVITYTFLDNGSNSSFCTESLMKQLEINSQQVKISLSTLEKKKQCNGKLSCSRSSYFRLGRERVDQPPNVVTQARDSRMQRRHSNSTGR